MQVQNLIASRAFLAAVVVVVATLAFGLVIPPWRDSVQKVCNRSDIVVMARLLSIRPVGMATNAISSRLHDEKGGANTGVDVSGMAAFQLYETTFGVEAVLKGNLETNQLILVHYSWSSNATDKVRSMMNPPAFIVFCLQQEDRSPSTRQGHQYLLFLRQSGDGKFYPTTGLVAPAYSAWSVLPTSPLVHIAASDQNWEGRQTSVPRANGAPATIEPDIPADIIATSDNLEFTEE